MIEECAFGLEGNINGKLYVIGPIWLWRHLNNHFHVKNIKSINKLHRRIFTSRFQ